MYIIFYKLKSSYGGLSTLIVQSDYRERGFGKLVVLAVTKVMEEAGVSPHALDNKIFEENKKTENNTNSGHSSVD